jgi:hypothetical protein
MRKIAVVAACVALAGCVSPTPQTGGAGNYGTTSLNAGSSLSVEVVAGGSIPAASLAAGCAGFIYDTPDYVMNFQTTGTVTLNVRVRSDTNTTLVIRDPRGRWVCADDVEGYDPLLALPNAPAGEYSIWIGTATSGPSQYQYATLLIY